MEYIRNIFEWSLNTGKTLAEKDKKLGEILIFDLRSEDTPGRFLNKLSVRIADFNKRFGVNIEIPRQLYDLENKISGDQFYYLKSAILAGLVNALYSKKEEN
jgi:hypothetical protein